jgi:hypothetical protein
MNVSSPSPVDVGNMFLPNTDILSRGYTVSHLRRQYFSFHTGQQQIQSGLFMMMAKIFRLHYKRGLLTQLKYEQHLVHEDMYYENL